MRSMIVALALVVSCGVTAADQVAGPLNTTPLNTTPLNGTVQVALTDGKGHVLTDDKGRPILATVSASAVKKVVTPTTADSNKVTADSSATVDGGKPASK